MTPDNNGYMLDNTDFMKYIITSVRERARIFIAKNKIYGIIKQRRGQGAIRAEQGPSENP